MATSFLALLDDITTLLDDVAILSKVAAKKTAGVLGDDLALNANQVTGLDASRELPVVWAVAKGSLVNKVILVPAALAISAFLPWLVTPLLMVGGAYLCFEGVEKLAHKWLHSAKDAAHEQALHVAASDATIDLVALEKDKIKGAVRTDFILSAEIVVITLGTLAGATFLTRVSVLSVVSLLMTIGVYGIVAGIVKLDDIGLRLGRSSSGPVKSFGGFLVGGAPVLLKILSVLGTVAMFLVGGGIVLHGFHAASEILHHALGAVLEVPYLGALVKTALDGLFGVVVGIAVLAGVMGFAKVRKAFSKT